ncbi:hypothetical protein [Mycoplasma parvum]|uniref:Uncharacterized protein n=1 Tax=Mycoplasma parvum str. Indiana TaxID=1403316 RepID=U5NCR2_9MOLU|nr:hypothetical protein [Mycoplasma parvum]AGX89217.1 hypothetical protein PRV_02400 [Mycoplasma parvum str. Indiana]
MEDRKRTLEQIGDDELAKLFLYKNFASKNTKEVEISDLFAHTREEFFEENPEPDLALQKKLRKEIAEYSPLSSKIEKTIEKYKKKQEFLKKINSALSLKVRKEEELSSSNIPFLGTEYRYFYTYLAQFKRELKNAWIEFNGFVEITLKAPQNFDKLKKFEIYGAVLLLTMLGFLLFGKTFLFNWEKVRFASEHINFFSNWTYAIVILSAIACIAIVFPYIILGIFYFININYLYKTKYFHYFIISCGFVGAILFLTAFFNFLLYQWINYMGGWGPINLTYKSK